MRIGQPGKGVCVSGWAVSCLDQKQNRRNRNRNRREQEQGVVHCRAHGGAMSHQVLLASVNRSDLIWDGAKSRVPEVQTERSQCASALFA